MKKDQHTPKHAGDVAKSLKKAAYSYISLFLVIMVLIGTTVSWFTAQDNATVKSDAMNFKSGTGLRVNDGEDITNHIKVEGFLLDEASSVDGRNIFLPNGNLKSGVTGDMLYREATVGDKNKRFMYTNFNLRGDSENTNVYVKSYTITVGDQTFNGSTQITFDDSGLVPLDTVHHEKCPVRIAFIEDSQDTPKVFDPTAIVDQYANTYNAVSKTNLEGKMLSTSESTSVSFAHNYFINNTPLFQLDDSKIHDITLVAWLEGTGENCDKYEGQKISIDLELESNWDDMEWITFVDQTKGDSTGALQQWVGDGECLVTMTYKDVTTTGEPYRTVVMNPVDYKTVDGKQQGIKWQAPIPKDVVTDITFNRYDATSEIIYNAWYTKDNVQAMWNKVTNRPNPITLDKDLEGSRRKADGTNCTTYTAQRGNGFSTTKIASERLSPSVGYWGSGTSSGGGGSGSGGSGTGGGGTGGTEATDLKVTVYLNANDNKQWIRDNLKSGNYEMRVVFDNGTTAAMTVVNPTIGDRCVLEDYDLNSSEKVTGFRLVNTKDNTYKELPSDKYFQFSTKQTTASFVVNDNDTVSGH